MAVEEASNVFFFSIEHSGLHLGTGKDTHFRVRMPAFRNPWFEPGTAWLESANAPSVPSLARTFAGFQSFQLKIAEAIEKLTILILAV